MIPTTLLSLTATGFLLGEKLRQQCAAEHLHKPQPFGECVRARYRSGRRLIFITATGIAVRTLAPVLRDKRQDPPVLVIDERGHFVIPLLSGHQGGANDWARELADRLEAHCVITSAQSYTHPLYIAGIGCERGCPAAAIDALIAATLHTHPVITDSSAITMAASVAVKHDERGLLEWASSRPLATRFYPAQKLLGYTDRLSEKSLYVFATVGCYGVAEAAALAGAEDLGGVAELVITKQKSERATFALARTYHNYPIGDPPCTRTNDDG